MSSVGTATHMTDHKNDCHPSQEPFCGAEAATPTNDFIIIISLHIYPDVHVCSFNFIAASCNAPV